MQVPEELARREKRLTEIARAKAVIEARAKQRRARERAEYEAKMAARDAKTAQTRKRPGGRVPQPPMAGPLPTDQVNLTDEPSRIMPVAGGGFDAGHQYDRDQDQRDPQRERRHRKRARHRGDDAAHGRSWRR